MENIKALLTGYILTTVTFGFLGDLGLAFLIGFVGAVGGISAKLLIDFLKKRHELRIRKQKQEQSKHLP